MAIDSRDSFEFAAVVMAVNQLVQDILDDEPYSRILHYGHAEQWIKKFRGESFGHGHRTVPSRDLQEIHYNKHKLQDIE